METEAPHDGAPPPPPPPPPTEPRPLRRSDHRYVAGVAGGLAGHFGIDPLLVRIAFIVLCAFGGAGLVAYAAGWLLIPSSTGHAALDDLSTKRKPLVVLLAVAAVVVVAWSGTWFHPVRVVVPVALIVLGVLVLTSSRHGHHGPAGPPPPSSPARDPAVVPPPPPHTHVPRRRNHWLTLGALGAVLATTGLLALCNVSAGIIAAADLAVVGAALGAGAWLGRSDGLFVLGALFVAVLALAGSGSLPYRSGVGDRTWTPVTVGRLHTYELFAGHQVIDLRALQLPAVGTTDVVVTQGFGLVQVLVPPGVHISGTSRVRAGKQVLLGRTTSGPDTGTVTIDDPQVASTDGPTVHLDIDLTAGRVEVTRRGS